MMPAFQNPSRLSQLEKAARLAGRTVEAAADRRAANIVQEIAPALSAALASDIVEQQKRLAARDREDQELLAACRAVGSALDRLDQNRHTREEIPARRALERTCVRLRRAINRKDVHDPR